MTASAQTARVLAESISELMNCAAHLLEHSEASPEVLRVLSDACDTLLDVLPRASNVQAPAQFDIPALLRLLEGFRAALADADMPRLTTLSGDLFQALGVPSPTTAA